MPNGGLAIKHNNSANTRFFLCVLAGVSKWFYLIKNVMAKKIKLEVTEAQLTAIVELADTISAMVGCGDNDIVWKKSVKLIDRMLKKNGYKRRYA